LKDDDWTQTRNEHSCVASKFLEASTQLTKTASLTNEIYGYSGSQEQRWTRNA